MRDLKSHAQLELEMTGLLSPDSDYDGMLGKAVLELLEVFANQGHSGASASIVSNLFNKLSRYEPLSPLTGKDEEWTLLDYGDNNLMYQNKRESGLFKHDDGIVTYNSDIVKRYPNGTCWTGPLYPTREDAINNTNRIQVKVKGFPFTPKTFYIDVIEEEIEEDNWIMWVKDPKQLDEVFEYYEQIK